MNEVGQRNNARAEIVVFLLVFFFSKIKYTVFCDMVATIDIAYGAKF